MTKLHVTEPQWVNLTRVSKHGNQYYAKGQDSLSAMDAISVCVLSDIDGAVMAKTDVTPGHK